MTYQWFLGYALFCAALAFVVFAPGAAFWRGVRRLSRRKW